MLKLCYTRERAQNIKSIGRPQLTFDLLSLPFIGDLARPSSYIGGVIFMLTNSCTYQRDSGHERRSRSKIHARFVVRAYLSILYVV